MISGTGEFAASFAIFAAKQAGAAEVTPDHILLGCLRTIAHLGIAAIGPWSIDLEALGVDWIRQPEGARPRLAYSQAAVEVFDLAVRIAKASGQASVGVEHLLAAFAGDDRGLMGELKRTHGIGNATWRAAIAQASAIAHVGPGGVGTATTMRAAAEEKQESDYLTPEEAAKALGVHVQTMRSYIRSERLPAFRLAGERAIRIRRVDLEKVLEPLSKDQ